MDLNGDDNSAAPGRDPAVMQVLAKFLATNKRLCKASETQHGLLRKLEQLRRGQHGGEQRIGGDLRGVHENGHESKSQVEDVGCEQWQTESEAIVVESLRLQKEVDCLTDQKEELTDEFDEVCKRVDPHVFENDTLWDRLQTEQKILEFWAPKVSSEVEELMRKLEECGCVEVENLRWEATQSQSISQSESTEGSEEVSMVASSVRKLSGSELSEEFDTILDCLRGNRSEMDDLKGENEEEPEERFTKDEDLAPNQVEYLWGEQQINDMERHESAEKRLDEECLFSVGTPKGSFSPKGGIFFCNRLPELFAPEKEHGITNSKSLELKPAVDGGGDCESSPKKECGEQGKEEDWRADASAEKDGLVAEVKFLKQAKSELEEKLQEMAALVSDVRKSMEVAVKAKTEMEARMTDMEAQMKAEEENLLALKQNLQGVSAAKRSLHSKVIYTEFENKRLREELAEKEREKSCENNSERSLDWVCNSPSQEMDGQVRMAEPEAAAPAHITQREIECMANVEDQEKSGVLKWAVRLGGSVCGSIIAGRLLNGFLGMGSKN
ncbi:hypothetical protein BSKO_03428 [Bryopsis sp. KO-2023]|nr:hypothetical protein BSKO_03428 [Bryopsis sp. KO-2023]